MSGSAPTAQSVCEYIVRRIVDDPDAVTVIESRSGSSVRFEVSVADGDMGRVIGKRGRVAGAIRTVVQAAGSRDDAEIEVEFVD